MALPPDLHVHTEWSYDGPNGSMEKSCERAIALGLPGIAFTDHADFVKVHADQHCVDIDGYLDAIARCRAKFRGLRILSGVELGEPHWFPAETRQILSAGPLDKVLGSVHCVKAGDEIVDASQFVQRRVDALAATRDYFGELLAMLETDHPFEALAHLDYPKRYWSGYLEKDYEDEIRAVLKAAVRTGRVLEVNTTRGERLCPDLTVVRWWRELGGRAVQYGSDAHSPDKVGEGFRLASQMVEAAGFKPARDPVGLWRR